MSYHEEIRREIGTSWREHEGDEAEIVTAVEHVFSRALEEARVTGQSIESIVYEILEGVDEALGVRQEHKERILSAAVERMAKTMQQDAGRAVERSAEALRLARMRFDESIEREKAHLKEMLGAFLGFAQEKAYKRVARLVPRIEQRLLRGSEPVRMGEEDETKIKKAG